MLEARYYNESHLKQILQGLKKLKKPNNSLPIPLLFETTACAFRTQILTKEIIGCLSIIIRFQRQKKQKKTCDVEKGSSFSSILDVRSIFSIITQFTHTFNNKKFNA